MYQSAATIQKRFEISRSTLVKWADNAIIRVKRLDGGKRIYHIRDIETKLGGGINESSEEKKKVIYARVSSSKQKEDLERQVQGLQEKYPSHVVYKDIGSGLNFRRKRFEALLDGIFREVIGEIVVSYRDRLCRYGFELFELFCKHHGAKIVVSSSKETTDNHTELAEDLLAVCNFFVARNNGRRSHQRKKAETVSIANVEEDAKKMDGDSKVDLQQMSRQIQEGKVSNVEESVQEQGNWITQPRSDQKKDGEDQEETRTRKRKLEEDQHSGEQTLKNIMGSGNTARDS